VARLDRGVERVTIDMGDRQRVELGMLDKAGRPATLAAARAGGNGRQRAALAAQRAHGVPSGASPGDHSQAAPRTPLASPWLGGSRRVTTSSENTCWPQRRGTA